MKAQSRPAAGVSDPLSAPGLRVVTIYEDLGTGNRAMRVFDALLQHCGKEVTFRTDMWKFDTLRCPSMSGLALQDARVADVIIVSGHGSEELPEEVLRWFSSWIGHRNGRPVVLLALLDHAPGLLPQFDPAYRSLEQIAKQAHMDFIPMSIEQEDNEMSIRHAISGVDDPPPLLEAFCRKIAHAPAGGVGRVTVSC